MGVGLPGRGGHGRTTSPTVDSTSFSAGWARPVVNGTIILITNEDVSRHVSLGRD